VARKPADQSVNRKEIILAAADVLHRNGYEATTMKDIAAEVNLTAASLYHHFRNKDALLLAVLEGGIDLVFELIEPIAADETKSFADRLTDMIKVHVYMVTQNTAVGAAMVFEIRSLLGMSGLNGGTRKIREELQSRRDEFFVRRDDFEKIYRDVLQAGIAAGEFRQVDIPIFVKAMLGANNWVAVWYREGGRLDGEEIASRIANTFIESLCRK
jgi:TetR/AcrR family transcriptional regulator, cholesterol catabolism regulator